MPFPSDTLPAKERPKGRQPTLALTIWVSGLANNLTYTNTTTFNVKWTLGQGHEKINEEDLTNFRASQILPLSVANSAQ